MPALRSLPLVTLSEPFKTPRRRRGRSQLAAFALLLGALIGMLAPSAAGAAEAAPPGFFGVSESQMSPADFDLMVEADAGTFRTVYPFAAVDPQPGEPFNWDFYDFYMRETAIRGIDLMPNLYGVPPYLSEERSTVPLGSKELVGQWRRYLTELVERYGPEGDFWELNPYIPYHPITIWQIWNEPNSITWWAPRPDPREYGLLLERSADAIQAVDPKAQIMTAGIVARPTNRHAIPGAEYLRRLLDDRGARQATDILGFHPFAPAVPGVRKQIVGARKILRSSGLGSAPIWITEVGWGSRGNQAHPLIKSEKGQVRALRGTFQMVLRERQRLGIDRLAWYHWRDYSDDLCRWCESSGLINRNLARKPIFEAFRQIATLAE